MYNMQLIAHPFDICGGSSFGAAQHFYYLGISKYFCTKLFKYLD